MNCEGSTILFQQLGVLLGICSIVIGRSYSNSSANYCVVDRTTRGTLDWSSAIKPAQLLTAVRTSSSSLCSSHCCNTTKCNIYIWREGGECFLFFCKVLKDCKVVQHSKSITGFISATHIQQIQGLENADVETPQNSSRLPSIAESGIIIKSAGQNNIERENTPTVAPKVSTEKLWILGRRHKETPNDATGTFSKKEFESNVNFKAHMKIAKGNETERIIPVLNMSTASEKVSHTTTTSLIAALVFGVVFLIAIAAQIGKPWWESLLTNRDGYSRITFLMNGK